MDKKEIIIKAIDNGFYYKDKDGIHFADGAAYIGDIDAGAFVIPEHTENPTEYSYNLANSTFYRIEDYGRTWALTEEELEVKSKAWKPKLGEKYWYIDENVELDEDVWINSEYFERIYAIGNCFKTKEDCEFAIERLKVIKELERFAEENNERIEWCNSIDNDANKKWHISYDYDNSKLFADYTYVCKHNDIYFSSKYISQKAIGTIGEERIKKYYLKVEE